MIERLYDFFFVYIYFSTVIVFYQKINRSINIGFTLLKSC